MKCMEGISKFSYGCERYQIVLKGSHDDQKSKIEDGLASRQVDQ